MTKTKSMIYCGLFTALIAAGAFIKIPVPVVPFTLQYLFTMLAGLFLGSRRGMISVVAYMLLGLAGLPIFSEGGGIWYIFKPRCDPCTGHDKRDECQWNRLPLSLPGFHDKRHSF